MTPAELESSHASDSKLKTDAQALLAEVGAEGIPRHVAIIMDGNGRWAAQRGFERSFGHRNGAASVRRAIHAVKDLGIEVLTLYSFSTDNWKRPNKEVDALMQLCETYCLGEREALVRENIRFRVIGRREGLPDNVLEALDGLTLTTQNNTGPTLCLAINYGSRQEIVDAAQKLACAVSKGELNPEDIDESALSSEMYTADLPDPDLLIRTAGELRLSNFLLWQLSYCELYATDVLWPDFTHEHLFQAIRAYANRQRRYGGLSDQSCTCSPDSSTD